MVVKTTLWLIFQILKYSSTYDVISQNWVKELILKEHVSPVIRRSLSNVNGDLKKAVRFGGQFLKILDFFVSRSDVLNSKFGQKG